MAESAFIPLKDDCEIGILVKRAAIPVKSLHSANLFLAVLLVKRPRELGEGDGLLLIPKHQQSSTCTAIYSWRCTILKRFLRGRLTFL